MLPFQVHSSICDTFHVDGIEVVYQQEELLPPSVHRPLGKKKEKKKGKKRGKERKKNRHLVYTKKMQIS